MAFAESVSARALRADTRAMARRARDADAPNPRDPASVPWAPALVSRTPEMRAEWDAFRAAGGRLPRIEDVLGEGQGNEGAWRAGLLVSQGATVAPLADRFPATVAAALAVPGLLNALLSVLDPGTELPAHRGPNGGVLRGHVGIDCGDASALRVGDVVVPYRDGGLVLFDDTADHAAWNRGERPRVTLFIEVLRDAPPPWSYANRAVQTLLGRDRRYRSAPARAAEWDMALNPGRAPSV